jgi:hypothetical protein
MQVCARKKNRLKSRFAAGGRRSRAIPAQLSTKDVDKCVDEAGARHGATLQKCDIVKLLNFSPVIFDLYPQILASGC